MILVEEGQSPIVLCLPHSGTDLPNAVEKRLNATGRLQADLAWRLERVFDFHKELDVTVLRSSVSRYVIDLDRDPETPVDRAMNPAEALCPATTLDGKRIYQDGEEPGPTEIEQRTLLFHAPFHKALRRQVDRLQRQHRNVIILDCQSMRSHIKGVTENGLPLVSIGTLGGSSCDPDLRNTLVGSFKGQQGYTVSVDEQMRGGFISQSFGRPDRGLHAVSVLLAQRSYLRHESPPFEPDKTRLTRLRAVLVEAMTRLVDWTGMGGAGPIEPDSSGKEAPLEEPTEKASQGEEASPPEQLDTTSATADDVEKAEIIPVDPMTLTRVSQSQTGKVEDGPVTPLLVAE
ncbi:N-formylglutamate amidohydrolase [Roseibium sp.]|uniref:N-formylglutamate amidohydrolase n=1 Tax=Roseibium sp. TaxID=1936156 RepID=UPI003BB0182D